LVLETSYKLILFIIPFICIITFGWVIGLFPDSSKISKLLSFIAEENLETLLKCNGFSNTKLFYFQGIRILFALCLTAAIYIIFGFSGITGYATLVVIFIGFYKLFYFYLVNKDNQRIKKLNMVLPYTIKSIAYLANVFPVNNALLKSIEIVPKEFQQDIEMLCKDIDKDPTSFTPYQKFIDRYDGRLNRLDYYLKLLYRMSMSATKEEVKLLTNLNETISEEMSNARRSKNETINKSVTWLGLIPVALLTIMLVFLMIEISVSI